MRDYNLIGNLICSIFIAINAFSTLKTVKNKNQDELIKSNKKNKNKKRLTFLTIISCLSILMNVAMIVLIRINLGFKVNSFGVALMMLFLIASGLMLPLITSHLAFSYFKNLVDSKFKKWGYISYFYTFLVCGMGLIMAFMYGYNAFTGDFSKINNLADLIISMATRFGTGFIVFTTLFSTIFWDLGTLLMVVNTIFALFPCAEIHNVKTALKNERKHKISDKQSNQLFKSLARTSINLNNVYEYTGFKIPSDKIFIWKTTKNEIAEKKSQKRNKKKGNKKND